MRKYNRKSIFVTLLVSFNLVLLFPILAEVWLYVKMETIIKDQANRSSIAMLNQVSDILDNELSTMNLLSAQIAFNPKLQNLLSQQRNDEQEMIRYYHFMKDLKTYNISESFVHDYYVYLPKEDVIISPKIKTSSEFFYKNYYGYENISYEEWKEEVHSIRNSSTYLPARAVEGLAPSPRHIITYVEPLPTVASQNPKGYLTIFINKQKIVDALQNVEWFEDGNMFIVDQNNQLIMSVGEEEEMFDLLQMSFSEPEGAYEVSYLNRNYITTYTISRNSNWKYMFVVPKDVVMSKVNNVKIWAYSLLLFCLAAGFIGSYYLANRHYSPIKELVLAIANQRKNQTSPRNEYEIIRESLDTSWANERNLAQKLKEYTPQVKANFLTRLLKGVVEKQSITADILQFMDIAIIGKRFVVLVMDVEDSGVLKNEEDEKQWVLTRFIVMNISEEIVNEKLNGYVVELDQKQIGIIVNFPDDINVEKELAATVQRIKQYVEARFEILISIGVGLVHEGIHNVAPSYREAIQALNYRMIKGNHQIVYFQETKEAESHYFYPEGMEVQLMNFIKLGDYQNAELLLDEIYRENFQERYISFEIGQILFFNIMSTHLQIIQDIHIQYEAIFPHEENPTMNLLQCETAEEMHFKIKAIYKRICDYVNANKTTQSERLLQQITNYIEKNYTNNMLSLSLMAEEMKITPQYLSAFYKKQTGENITDTIAKVRLQHAKQLLKEEEMTIAQIAKKVGYSNDIGLIRLFKKYEGVTPGSYRTRLKEVD